MSADCSVDASAPRIAKDATKVNTFVMLQGLTPSFDACALRIVKDATEVNTFMRKIGPSLLGLSEGHGKPPFAFSFAVCELWLALTKHDILATSHQKHDLQHARVHSPTPAFLVNYLRMCAPSACNSYPLQIELKRKLYALESFFDDVPAPELVLALVPAELLISAYSRDGCQGAESNLQRQVADASQTALKDRQSQPALPGCVDAFSKATPCHA
eukprot:1153434-Pelagomonas_calceolata.AAC.5